MKKKRETVFKRNIENKIALGKWHVDIDGKLLYLESISINNGKYEYTFITINNEKLTTQDELVMEVIEDDSIIMQIYNRRNALCII